MVPRTPAFLLAPLLLWHAVSPALCRGRLRGLAPETGHRAVCRLARYPRVPGLSRFVYSPGCGGHGFYIAAVSLRVGWLTLADTWYDPPASCVPSCSIHPYFIPDMQRERTHPCKHLRRQYKRVSPGSLRGLT